MDIRRLNKEDNESLKKLIDVIETHVVNPQWWLPIKQEAYDNFLNPDWTIFLGAFVDNDLIGASALFLNEFEYGESLTAVGKQLAPIAEIGRCMVHPKYRKQNIMLLLNRELYEIAKKMGIKTLIATAHPDNLASNCSLQTLGMKIEKCILKENQYLRNILLMKI